MTDTTAKVRSKGLDATGVTEEVAGQMYAHKGRHYMAIVEVMVDERHDKAGGKKRVDLVIEQFEPAEHGSDLEKHLRSLTSVAYQNRGVTDAQQALDDTLTPSLTDAIAAGQQHAPHPFLPVDAADDDSICDVCGVVEDGNPAHAAYTDRPTVADPFEPTASTEEEAAPAEEQPVAT